MINSLYDLAQRYVGIQEIVGQQDHPLVVWWLSLCTGFNFRTKDEVAWCSAFINGMAWELRLPRSKSAAARSWLLVGTPVSSIGAANVDNDVVILKRGKDPQPNASVIAAQGHVTIFAGLKDDKTFFGLGGNQANGVCVGEFEVSKILGIRRLA